MIQLNRIKTNIIMTRLNPKLIHKFIVSSISRRKIARNRSVLHKHFHSLEILKKYGKIHNLFNQRRMFFMKTLVNATYCPFRCIYSNWWEKFHKFSDNQWLKYLRMRKETFTLLVNQITPFMQSNSNQIAMQLDKQIALTLIYLSSGKTNKYLGRLFSIPFLQVKSIVENVCLAIIHLMPNYIKIPSETEVKENMSEFQNKWGFPQCGGVLGSMHIPLKRDQLPGNAADYMNNNSDYSLLLQCVVDGNYRFWDINIGWPGSVPESRVLTNSSLWLKGQDNNLFPEGTRVCYDVDIPIYILAGAAYPLTHWVLRPFLNEPSTKKETVFNEKFTFAFNACEIALKRLKARWQCLVSRNICSIEILPSIISACCILHNICELYNEPIFDKWMIKAESYFKQPISLVCSSVIGPKAESIRTAVCDYLTKII